MIRGKDSDNNKGTNGNQSKRKRRVSSTTSNSDKKLSSSPSSSTKDLVKQLPDDFEPGEFDVVCSRGKQAMNSPGNVRYRALIKENLQRYSTSNTKQEKSAIVSNIIDNIQSKSPQGGFVRSVNNRWYKVSDHIAREKTGQSFRDMLHTQYRSSTKAKRKRQKEKEREDFQKKRATEGEGFPSTGKITLKDGTMSAFSISNATENGTEVIANHVIYVFLVI